MVKKRKVVDSDSESSADSIDSSPTRKKKSAPAAPAAQPPVVQKAKNTPAKSSTAKKLKEEVSESESDSDGESSFGASSKSAPSPVKKSAESKISTKKVAISSSSHSDQKSNKSSAHADSSFSSIPSSALGTDNLTSGGPVTTEAAAKKLISQYLKMQNRPYSAIQIHDNLHGRVPKAVTERALVFRNIMMQLKNVIVFIFPIDVAQHWRRIRYFMQGVWEKQDLFHESGHLCIFRLHRRASSAAGG